ncbi:hypothetical protein ACJA23_01275 [Mycoplasma corogypsi]|uniref:hypothetical protein n=1 Tax=Mycoplasma corogypsi TaxID=2106 RepID=UPI0038731EF7
MSLMFILLGIGFKIALENVPSFLYKRFGARWSVGNGFICKYLNSSELFLNTKDKVHPDFILGLKTAKNLETNLLKFLLIRLLCSIISISIITTLAYFAFNHFIAEGVSANVKYIVFYSLFLTTSFLMFCFNISFILAKRKKIKFFSTKITELEFSAPSHFNNLLPISYETNVVEKPAKKDADKNKKAQEEEEDEEELLIIRGTWADVFEPFPIYNEPTLYKRFYKFDNQEFQTYLYAVVVAIYYDPAESKLYTKDYKNKIAQNVVNLFQENKIRRFTINTSK